MKNKIAALWLSLTMIFSFLLIIDVAIDFTPTVRATTLYVNETGSGGAFTSIQDAINVSSDGDTVFVYNGTYYENVVVNKTINLTGEDRSTTKINGSGLGDVVVITIDWVNITGFNITGSGSDSGDAGIQLDNVQYCRIEDDSISNNCYGIYVMNLSSNNTIIDCSISNSTSFGAGIYISNSDDIWVTNCNIYNTSMSGIGLLYSSKVRISNSTVINCFYGISAYDSPGNSIFNCSFDDGSIGIRLSLSPNSTLKNNSISNNRYNLEIVGSDLYDYFQDIEDTNTINSKPIYYIIEQSDLEFNESMNIGYLGLVSCVNITVRNLTVSENGHAVLLVNTTGSLVNNVGCFNNRWGVYTWKSSYNTISNCSFDFNYWANIGIEHQSIGNLVYNCTIENNPNQYGGILIQNSLDNLITQCNIYNNRYGIYVMESSINNTITANTISWNYYNGIHIDSSFSTSVIGNNITDNDIGIYIQSSLNSNIMTNNISSNNEEGIYLREDSSNNTITGCNVSNNYMGIILDYSSNNNVVENTNLLSNVQHAIWLEHSSSNNTIIGCNMFNNWGYGVYLSNSIYNNITLCNIFNNGEGISLYESSNNIITANRIHNNTRGIYYWYLSKNNIITDCDLSNNGQGIHIGHSTSSNNYIRNCNVLSNTEYGIYFSSFANSNYIYHNNIIDNTIQAYDDSNNGNQWDNGYPSGGNYWSDYNGIDLNSTASQDVPPPDEIGDTPYVVDSDSQDNYPLMNPIGNCLFLYEGWSLISIPFIQSDTNLGQVLSPIQGAYDAVQWLNATDPADPWKHNSTSKPSHLNDLDRIDHTMGFWIHISEPGVVLFKYPGTQPTVNQTITLHPGWNMVGYPSFTSYNRTEGLNNLTFDDQVDAIWSYDAATQKGEEMGESDYFEIGKGYYIHAKSECEWEVPL